MTRLRYTNHYKETFWFVALGEPWPHEPDKRLIARTTPHERDATVFKTEAEVLDVLKTAGTPPGWEAVTSPD